MITMNELFSGIGAQKSAMDRLGIECNVVGISDVDKYANQSYYAIHGQTRQYGDISKIDHLDYADLWTYSFPCQDLSVAGKQAGIKEGTRSGLLFEVERLLDKAVKDGTQPKYLLLENVKALVSKKFFPDFQRWLNRLDEMGYKNYWKVLNAKNYGVPQNRERVFVVSIRKDIQQTYEFPKEIPLTKRLKDVLETNVDEKYYLSDDKVARFTKNIQEKETHLVSNQGRTIGKKTDVATTLMARDYKGFGNQATNCVIEPMCCASRGRNPDNPSDRTAGSPTEQRLEFNENGTSNTITTVAKDNYVAEPQIIQHDVVMNVSVRKNEVDIKGLQNLLREHKNKSCKDIALILDVPQTKVEHWFRTDDCFAIPEPNVWYRLKALLGIETEEFDKQITEFEIKENVFEKSNRVYDSEGISPTITCTNADEKIVEPMALDEQNGYIRKDGCVGTLTTDGSSPKHNNRVVEPQVKQVGNIVDTGNWDNPQRGRIYSPYGCSPSLNTVGGGGLEPKVMVEGYFTYPNSDKKHQSNTVISKDGISTTLDTMSGGNLQPKITEMYNPYNKSQIKDIAPTQTTMCDNWNSSATVMIKYDNLRIRKLTPRECWRLMGFTDEEFDKAQASGVSNSQLYKQAGNSIVVDVLSAIFRNIFINKEQETEPTLL